MSLLSVANLAVSRAGLPVLEGLDFSLDAGCAIVLRGPNGIGKTTLLRTLAGLQPALAGSVSVRPETMAYAGHSDGVKSTLTVTENLKFWACVHATGQIDAALAQMNLRQLANRAAMSLSAGQKRRLGLARLLVTGRPIWVLDEPGVSLDAASVARFARAVRAHLATGGAALIATHIDLGFDEAESLDLVSFKALSPEEGGMRGTFDEAFL